MDTIRARGHRIAYERRWARGRWWSSCTGVGDRRTWRCQVDDLSDEFTVVAWDAPGFGGSSDPHEAFRLPDFADCLAEFVAALGAGRRTSSACPSAGGSR